jgi:hypothetical protein
MRKANRTVLNSTIMRDLARQRRKAVINVNRAIPAPCLVARLPMLWAGGTL